MRLRKIKACVNPNKILYMLEDLSQDFQDFPNVCLLFICLILSFGLVACLQIQEELGKVMADADVQLLFEDELPDVQAR